MYDNSFNYSNRHPDKKPQREKRIFYRIPIKISAKLFINLHSYKKVILNDLSSTGLSFKIDKHIDIPTSAKICFRLPSHLTKIDINLKIINTRIADDMLIVGCCFIDPSENTRKIITDYIVKFTDFSPYLKTFSLAAFLVLLDSLLRITAYSAIKYYQGTAFLKGNPAATISNTYILILIAYTISSFISFFNSGNIKKRNILLSIYSAVLASLFIITKSIIHFKMHLWASNYLFIRIYFWIEIALLIYIETAMILLISSIKKINLFSKSIKEHIHYREEMN